MVNCYSHDLVSRRTNIVMTAQTGTNMLACAYNARSEVTGVTIDTNEYAYIYDNIGNSLLYTSINIVTNAFTVKNLNQYKAVTNLLDLSGFRLGHDADGNTTLIDNQVLSYDAENRLSAYTFGLGSETGMLRSVYSYDYLGRRVKKLNQESKIKNPGGFIPLTYWHTNEVATYVYDGWNLVHESIALTNGNTEEVSYFWGKDSSGSLQGAGGVGGLLAASIDGDFYFPCYDNNGNITTYIDEGGAVIAYRVFDAFGNTIAKGGDLVDVFHFWFSTKYFDHDTGLYYYGYRYYSPMLQRWINRDPIGESGGWNMYGFVGNNATHYFDKLGLVSWEEIAAGVVGVLAAGIGWNQYSDEMIMGFYGGEEPFKKETRRQLAEKGPFTALMWDHAASKNYSHVRVFPESQQQFGNVVDTIKSSPEFKERSTFIKRRIQEGTEPRGHKLIEFNNDNDLAYSIHGAQLYYEFDASKCKIKFWVSDVYNFDKAHMWKKLQDKKIISTFRIGIRLPDESVNPSN